MPAITSENQVIATIVVDADGSVKEVMSGKVALNTSYNATVHVTERMLLDMNGMMRAKWEAIKADADADWQKRKANPLTPEQSF